jgi:hypothetical protein
MKRDGEAASYHQRMSINGVNKWHGMAGRKRNNGEIIEKYQSQCRNSIHEMSA